jgi:hypothetical protein
MERDGLEYMLGAKTIYNLIDHGRVPGETIESLWERRVSAGKVAKRYTVGLNMLYVAFSELRIVLKRPEIGKRPGIGRWIWLSA